MTSGASGEPGVAAGAGQVDAAGAALPKHPHGRAVSIGFAALKVAEGLVGVVTLGEVSPPWSLHFIMNAALRTSRSQRPAASGEGSDRG